MMNFQTRNNKYGVAAKEDRTVDGIVFASKKEATRYGELKLLQDAGKIFNLALQPKWKIVINEVHVCSYIGDFRYLENGQLIIEDAKGVATPVYRLKKKLMKAVHGILIKEV